MCALGTPCVRLHVTFSVFVCDMFKLIVCLCVWHCLVCLFVCDGGVCDLRMCLCVVRE